MQSRITQLYHLLKNLQKHLIYEDFIDAIKDIQGWKTKPEIMNEIKAHLEAVYGDQADQALKIIENKTLKCFPVLLKRRSHGCSFRNP